MPAGRLCRTERGASGRNDWQVGKKQSDSWQISSRWNGRVDVDSARQESAAPSSGAEGSRRKEMKTREKGDAGMAPARRRKKFKRRTPSHSRRQWLLANHGRVSVRAKDAPIARRQLPQRTHAKGLQFHERPLRRAEETVLPVGRALLPVFRPSTGKNAHPTGIFPTAARLNGLSRFWGALGAGLLTSPKPPTAGLPRAGDLPVAPGAGSGDPRTASSPRNQLGPCSSFHRFLSDQVNQLRRDPNLSP